MAHTNRKSNILEKLIKDEWAILRDLRKVMNNPDLSLDEKIRAANAFGYHASVLSKLIAQKGQETQLNETTLGEFITGVEPRIARHVLVGFKHWMKTLSRKR